MHVGLCRAYCESGVSQNSFYHLTSISPYLAEGSQVFLVKTDSLLLPQCTITLVKCHKVSSPLRMDWRKAFGYFSKVLPQENLATPLFKGFSTCKLTQVWKLVHKPRVPFATKHLLENFLLIQIKQIFSRLLLSISCLETP